MSRPGECCNRDANSKPSGRKFNVNGNDCSGGRQRSSKTAMKNQCKTTAGEKGCRSRVRPLGGLDLGLCFQGPSPLNMATKPCFSFFKNSVFTIMFIDSPDWPVLGFKFFLLYICSIFLLWFNVYLGGFETLICFALVIINVLFFLSKYSMIVSCRPLHDINAVCFGVMSRLCDSRRTQWRTDGVGSDTHADNLMLYFFIYFFFCLQSQRPHGARQPAGLRLYRF